MKAGNATLSEIHKVELHGSVTLQQQLARADDPLRLPTRVLKFTQPVPQKSGNVETVIKTNLTRTQNTRRQD